MNDEWRMTDDMPGHGMTLHRDGAYVGWVQPRGDDVYEVNWKNADGAWAHNRTSPTERLIAGPEAAMLHVSMLAGS